MKKTTTKAAPKKKLALNKKTIAVLSDRSIIANLQNTKRPVIVISMGCGSDFTRYLPANWQKLMTDFTKPGK
jgi:3-dehydroquinate dehydratase